MPETGPVAIYLAELSEGSHRGMLRALRLAAEFFGGSDPARFRWHRLRVQHLTALRADLAAGPDVRRGLLPLRRRAAGQGRAEEAGKGPVQIGVAGPICRLRLGSGRPA